MTFQPRRLIVAGRCGRGIRGAGADNGSSVNPRHPANISYRLDADTGELKWHYQFTPHDTHDWDSNHIPVLADVRVGGQTRKAVMVANRNGFFYVLDRATGKVLLAKPFTDTNWAREIGADGRPIVLEEMGTNKGLPDFWGGTNFMPPSCDPALNLFFVTARETCVTYVAVKPEITVGQASVGGGVRRVADRIFDCGALRAIDASTGDRKWELRYAAPSLAGVMSTASGLVFASLGDDACRVRIAEGMSIVTPRAH